MNKKEKMQALIASKKGSGKVKHKTTAPNDGKFMRKAPILHK